MLINQQMSAGQLNPKPAEIDHQGSFFVQCLAYHKREAVLRGADAGVTHIAEVNNAIKPIRYLYVRVVELVSYLIQPGEESVLVTEPLERA